MSTWFGILLLAVDALMVYLLAPRRPRRKRWIDDIGPKEITRRQACHDLGYKKGFEAGIEEGRKGGPLR